jgi:hypothetical protein
LVKAALSNESFWGMNLADNNVIYDNVLASLKAIEAAPSVYDAVKEFNRQ